MMKNKNNLKAFFLATVFICIMMLMRPTQDTGDDAFIAWQLSRGIGSIGSFISPYFSLIVSALYQYFPWIAWWSVIHVMSAWTLLIVMISIITKHYKSKDCGILYLILFASIWIAIVKRVNFTRTAACFAIAGIVLIVNYNFRKEYGGKSPNLRYILCGYALYILGCMIRLQAALMVLPFMLIYGFLKVNETHYKGEVNKRKLEKLILLIIPFFISILFIVSQHVFWETHPEWKEYNEYNSVRSTIVDYVDTYPTWEEAEEEYIACGLKEANDLKLLFDKAFVGDTEVYTLETLKNIQKLSKNDVGFKERINATFDRIRQMLTEGQVQYWLFLLIVYMYIITNKKMKLVYMLNLATAFAILGFFSFLGRMMLRVWEPILLCVISMSIIYFETTINVRSQYKFGRILDKIVIISLSVFLLHCTGIIQDIQNAQLPSFSDDRDEVTRARAEYIESNPDKLYLLSHPLIHHSPNPGFFGIWEPLPVNYCNNYFALSNWDARTPVNLNRFNEIGIVNPTRALIDRIDVYSEFMDDSLFEFLKCHYGKKITCSFVDEFADTGAIVQYTKPIEEYRVNNEQNCEILDLISEISNHYSVKTWKVSGRIEGIKSRDYKALYCNIKKKNGWIYTFRLSYDKNNKFFAYLYDVDELWSSDVEESYLVGLKSDGRYSKLGTVSLFEQD